MKKFLKIIAIFLCSIMTLSICACVVPEDAFNSETNTDSETSWLPSDSGEESDSSSGGDEVGDIVHTGALAVSYDYKDYVGDLETFVYGLLVTKLEYIYDVFPACVRLSSGYDVYGLAYTDYSVSYTDEANAVTYFETGFMPFIGELDVPQEEFDSGLYVYDVEYESEDTSFIWAYKSEAFLQHCVVYGTYLQYGADVDGRITYNAIPFEREKCDTSLGALYSYDAGRYLYDVDFGEYLPISGVTLAQEIDFMGFEEEINAYIEEQNANWKSMDVEKTAYAAHDALKGYLLSLQTETFLDYPVDALLEAVKEIDPMECFRITLEGLTIIDIEEKPEEASKLTKWLVGSACVVAFAASFVENCFVPAIIAVNPPLGYAISAHAGMVSGVAIEIFMQVVVESQTLQNVSWTKVAISSVTGAVSGLLNPYFSTVFNGNATAYFFVDTAIDGIIGGAEQALFAFIDGADGKTALQKFGYGFVVGSVLSAVFKGIGSGISAIASKISKNTQKVAEEIAPKVTATASKMKSAAGEFGNAVGDKVDDFVKKSGDDISKFQYAMSKKTYQEILESSAKYGSAMAEAPPKLLNKVFRFLRKNGLRDAAGNLVTDMDVFKKTFLQADNNSKVGSFILKNGDLEEVVDVFKRNGVPNVEFDVKKYVKVFPDGGLSSNRSENFRRAISKFKFLWLDGEAIIPDEIQAALLAKYPGRTLDDILEFTDENKLVIALESIIQKSKWVLHEGIDGSVALVPRWLHDKAIGGISHMGGKAYMDYVKGVFGYTYFDEFVEAAMKGALSKLTA